MAELQELGVGEMGQERAFFDAVLYGMSIFGAHKNMRKLMFVKVEIFPKNEFTSL